MSEPKPPPSAPAPSPAPTRSEKHHVSEGLGASATGRASDKGPGCDDLRSPRFVTAIVNGRPVTVDIAADGEPLGALAHRVLGAEGYTWLTVEIRDEDGRPLREREPAAAYVGTRIWIAPPIGHGG